MKRRAGDSNGKRRPALSRIGTVCAVAAALCAGGMPAFAQPAKPGGVKGQDVITRERLEAAKAFMRAAGMEQRFERIIKAIARNLEAALARHHPGHVAAIGAAYASVANSFLQRKTDAIDMIAPLYAEKFTVTELAEARAFYESDLGRKVLAVQAEISQRSQSLGAIWAKRLSQQMHRAALAALKGQGIDLDTMPPARK